MTPPAVTDARVRRATLEDAQGILQCLRAAFDPYRTQYTPSAYEDTVMSPETVRQRLETMTVLVALNEPGQIIGTVGAAVNGPEGHIRGMAVAPSSQGSKVADDLLTSIEEELIAAGCSFVTLDTAAPLLRAIRFYERNGYVRTGPPRISLACACTSTRSGFRRRDRRGFRRVDR